MSDRKRKGEKYRSSPSSKKTKKRVLSLSYSEENSHIPSPVLVSFPFCTTRSGIPEESYSFEIKEEEMIGAVQVENMKKKTLSGKLAKQRRGEELVALRGTNWGEEAESRARCQYLIGINDPMTGVVKLHPVDHVFALAMQVLGRDNDDNNIKSEQPLHGNHERNALVMEFGSKLKKNAIKSTESNLVRDEAIAGRGVLHAALREEMESPQTVFDTAISTSEGVLEGEKKWQDQLDAAKRGKEEGRRAFLPSFNAGAVTPQEVYNIASIVPHAAEKELLRLLDAYYQEACACNADNVWTWNWLRVKNMPQYVVSRLEGLKDDGSDRLHIAHLLYLRAMIALAKAPALMRNTNTENVSVHVINAPEIIAHHLLANFCQKNIKGERISNYIRTNSLRDKLYVHALCLALILEPGCKLKLDTISSDLGIPVQRTQQLIKELGCKVKGDTAMLTVPLVFPKKRKINRMRDGRGAKRGM